MVIRPAVPDDKPAIIELLRKSLGESTIPKSELLWSWKHEQNPFGESFVLVAQHDNSLIGLRAFMQWQWRRNGKLYRAVRAVDTATHPDHQGKGIFRQLTMELLERCKQQGLHFVFNTPNEQSKPGYLKMGWVQLEVMPLKFKILRPVSILFEKFLKKKKFVPANNDPTPFQKWTQDVFSLASNAVQDPRHFTTAVSPEYISWRYGHNPLFNYNFFTDRENFLLISRIKEHSFGRELRLVDLVLARAPASPGPLNAFMKNELKAYCRQNGISFVSCSGPQFHRHHRYLRWMGLLPVFRSGPVVTLRDINMQEAFPILMKRRNWGYSLGDMELF